jgi:hypothetical protein
LDPLDDHVERCREDVRIVASARLLLEHRAHDDGEHRVPRDVRYGGVDAAVGEAIDESREQGGVVERGRPDAERGRQAPAG